MQHSEKIAVLTHNHTQASDGSLAGKKIDQYLKRLEDELERKVLFCPTDHNTIAGCEDMLEAGYDWVVPGIEIGCCDDDHPFRMVDSYIYTKNIELLKNFFRKFIQPNVRTQHPNGPLQKSFQFTDLINAVKNL